MQKVALITGGAQGIGKAISQELLQSGMIVVMAELDQEAGEESEAELKRYGKVLFLHTDVSDQNSVRQSVRSTVNHFGKLDVLVNNAGITDFYKAPPDELPLDEWNRVIATNLTGVFLCSKFSIPFLRKVGGSIVNIASTRAFQSEPNTEAYSASKGGIIALTHAMAISLGPKIRVNCISPGWIEVGQYKKKSNRHATDLKPSDHEQHPAGRVGTPQDIAKLVLYLVSESAGFITGQNFVADGGMTRKMIYFD